MSGMLDAMRVCGVVYCGEVVADGRIHRFATDNPHKQNGWYVCHGSYGAFGDWGKNISHKWHGDAAVDSLVDGGKSDYAFRNTAIKRHKADAYRKRHRSWLRVADKAAALWDTLPDTGYSEYLKRKQVGAFGLRFSGSSVLVPIRDINGKLWSYQSINNNGKRFLSGGKIKGGMHTIGNINPNGNVFVAEGYATAASIHMATGDTVIVCFSAGNMREVVMQLCRKYPELFITIAADNDQWKQSNTGKNTAYDISSEFGCNVVLPIFSVFDGPPTDFNDLHVLEGLNEVSYQLEVCHA